MTIQHYAEEDLVPISALQHLLFCERQFALIHLEGEWAENSLTLEGSHMHERVHTSGPRVENRGSVRIERGLHLRSFAIGLVGIADVVEFHRPKDHETEKSCSGLVGRAWTPYPVEYKRGKPKTDHSDEVQLCAQALCLEEMLKAPVNEGALFYGTNQRRQIVSIDSNLRETTWAAALRAHTLFRECRTPAADYSPKCEKCSLMNTCMPKLRNRQSVAAYMKRGLEL